MKPTNEFDFGLEGAVEFYSKFLDEEESTKLWDIIHYSPSNNMPWVQKKVIIGNKEVLESRLTAYLGCEEGLKFRYAGVENVSKKWPVAVEEVRKRVEKIVGHDINMAMMNW